MYNRRSGKGRIVTCASLFLGFSLLVTACSGGGEEPSDSSTGSDTASSSDSQKGQGNDSGAVDTDEVVAEIGGSDGVSVAVHSVVRDEGGFVTVNATLQNDGEDVFDPVRLRSDEVSIKSQSDISGVSLVDKEGKKRYMVLRDTDGQCLCTTDIPLIQSGDSRPIFAQFPAPPSSVTEVEFQIPTMTPATVELSEG